jgi:group I intron endonuclease
MAVKELIISKIITGQPHYLYAHLRADNNEPFYIGVGTIQKKSKYARSKSTSGRNSYWKNTVNKYGYKIVIFCETSNYKEALTKEQNYIQVLGLKKEKGYLVNMTLGGEGCLGYKHTDEYKNNLSKRTSGVLNPMYGTSMSKERKLVQSKRMQGSNNPRFGKTGINNPRSKTVYKINPFDNSVVEKYDSIRLAAKSVGVTHSSINKAIKNKTKSTNYYWTYGS